MKVCRALFYILTLFMLMNAAKLRAQSITLLQHGRSTSIRGLSVVNDSIAWISGSSGYISITINAGKTWKWSQVKGYEKADFRDIEAFSDKEAIIMSSGTPALIMKTIDGGSTWQVKYSNTDTTYFFDAMDFVNKKHGLVLGDPINNNFLLMETNDGGETWARFKNEPAALPGEACFAASGTCLRFDSDTSINIVTGGNQSRWLLFTDYKSASDDWIKISLAIIHGKPSQGAFSISGDVIVGGDYQNDHSVDSIVNYYYYTNQEHARGKVVIAGKPPSGFQSCVEHLQGYVFLSTGTPGSNLTADGGKTWKKINDASYNVCRKAKHGKLVLLAGNNGSIGIFQP